MNRQNFCIVFLGAFIVLLQGLCPVTAQKRPSKSLYKSVRNFGARADSTTDDTKAIQKAVNSGIGQISFPSGTYRLTTPIKIDLDKVGPVSLRGQGTARILMEGAGPAFKFVGTHGGTASPSTVRKNIWQSQRMPLVDGLEIVGRNPKAVGIQAAGTMQLTITRTLVRKALHGIHLTGRNRNVIISNSHLYHNSGIGIFLDKVDLHQINITGSHISYNGGGGIVVRGGQIRNLQIGSCDIEANMNENGPPTANILIDVANGGAVREGAITGSTIQHTGNAPESANIRFIGHGSKDRKKAGKFAIANNAISDAQYNLDIKYGRGFTITGNSFWKGFTNNILIQQSDHINLGPNLFDRNPDYSVADSKNNIVIEESRGLTIHGLHLNRAGGSAAIVLEQCKNYNLTNSTILNSDGDGVLLKDTANGKVSGNFINADRSRIKDPKAIRIQGGGANVVTNNYTSGIIDADSDVAKIIDNYLSTDKN